MICVINCVGSNYTQLLTHIIYLDMSWITNLILRCKQYKLFRSTNQLALFIYEWNNNDMYNSYLKKIVENIHCNCIGDGHKIKIGLYSQ